MVRKKLFFTGPTSEVNERKQNLFCRHNEPNKPTKEGPFSSVLLFSPIVPVSTVSNGHPSRCVHVTNVDLQRRQKNETYELLRLSFLFGFATTCICPQWPLDIRESKMLKC